MNSSALFFVKLARVKRELADAKATMYRSDYAALLQRTIEHCQDEATGLLKAAVETGGSL